MNAQIKNLAQILEKINSDARFGDAIRFDRVEYSEEQELLDVFFKTSKHLAPAHFLKLKKALAESCSTGLCILLDQSDFKQEFCDNKETLEKYIKDFIALTQPTVIPFIRSAAIRLKDNLLHIDFDSDMGEGVFLSMGVQEKVEAYLRGTYGIQGVVRTGVSQEAAGEYEPDEEIGRILAQQSKPETANVNKPLKPHPAVRPTGGNDDAPPWEDRPAAAPKKARAEGAAAPAFTTQICNLRADEKCTIEGEVVFTEDKELKDGELVKHKFVVCDYSASVTCFFLESSKYKTKLAAPKVGQWIVLSGMCTDDPYEHEKTIKAQRIERSSHKDREDTAEEKRVELHTHTQMSAQDGVSDVRKIIKRAAQWGHKAIAITDHGVVQAFPDAANAAKQNGIRVIYGVEAYMIDDSKKIYDSNEKKSFDEEYVVFDIETTGLSHINCDITEIGAVRVKNGEALDRFQTFVKPSKPIPPKIVSLTGITDDMVKDAPLPQEALLAFKQFCGEDCVLVAHNSAFDTKFIFHKSKEFGITYSNKVVDSLALCRLAFPKLKNHKLNTVAAHLRIPLDHHRAVNDAVCTAGIMLRCFEEFRKNDAQDMQDVNQLFAGQAGGKNARAYHTIILCKNKRGLRNLYKLISHAHLDHFYRKPRMPKSLIEEHREGIIIGSACEAGELYQALLAGASEKKLEEIAGFYDYLEIQPVGNNAFMVKQGILASEDDIRTCNRRIVELGKKLGKPVVATCDVHFLDPQDEYFRRIIFQVQGYDDTEQAPLYLRTTDEMLEEFAYLGEKTAYEVVVTNSNKIADMTEEIELFQAETAMPTIEGAAEKITELAFRTAKEKYGDPLPELIEARLKRELDSIVGHGFSVLYYSAHRLVKKSNEDGYLVGSRGSVGSSLAATMTGITEVNPLPPHYVCPNCKHSDFDVDKESYAVGVDLPDKDCPVCGTKYLKDGYDIPFEVFLGIDADKVPDIDLNFSGEYQPVAHKYTEVLFGEGHVFRAGTISAVKDKIAYGYVKKFLEQTGTYANEAEINRLVQGVSGVKKTTGQHPGGIVIVPSDREIYEFTPVQRPADAADAEWVTTHFDFNSMHDILIKLDILGHDVPTIIRLLQDMTGIDPLTIPLDDKPTMDLFSGLKPLKLKPADLLGIQTGTLGIPEFGTKFVRQMLMDTKPTSMAEIIRISGLSHGTDVWLGNAQDLIKAGTCTLREAICTRDDIMNYLVDKGVEKRMAFFIMEATRKGKIAKNGFSEDMQKALDDAHIAEWFIESCKKIKYMFPKAHAAAYVIMAYRIAYCKVHHPEAFYASYFTVRAGEFDASYVTGGLDDIKKNWQMLENKGKSATANEKNMATMLEVACEMYLRGIHFLPVDLKKSAVDKFLIEKGGIRLPFLSVPKLGGNAAAKIVEEREQADFLSIEDLRKRAKVSASVIEEMQKMGTLTGLTETNQLSLFDL
ncbi:PolC-type DNA polymerase III [Christensenella timonensis]|uniref:PolC-type DNA polymerase III n=1 Tax=Christensenella timonensis TaxID=1816678 RepID=UPI000829650C|nr:PolC-type DNA polymerase III [Christensenella timonensis]